ncbi:hypothetical protein EC973_007929 [Apophysomyces ossiformis]|uniref:Protein kinase domain-containing protein n=1 Tax=Apophysomyces ossiformis TaxID=679940 RepID=A0A8H7BNL2_9FUNG|nr:hypothetical protein EC973_007929 [Apophysomyces ossiformis]
MTKDIIDNSTIQHASSIRSGNVEDSPASSPPVQPATSPKPILMTSSPVIPFQGHSSRRSISGSDILNGFKIKPVLQNDVSSPQLSPDVHLFNNIDDFDIQTAIGYGSSAVVYSAIYKPSNKRVAIKMIDLDMFERNQIDELRPCWMAPEVMEQAGYDYKADIWSFGITAIELATGHAPFAKLPPLKVLMMTLSNDPPTLARETTKHKYSRTFKDMIDTCLHKDPAKRPSAEKLLQHPFFKQAKKREYLVKTIVGSLPPLEQRPHKKVPQRHVTITKTDEWDFDDDHNEEIEENNKSFEDHSRDQPVDVSQTGITSVNQTKSPMVKRHISFGDVIVRNPPQPSAIIPSGLITSNATGTRQSSEIVIPSGTHSRRSRFVIEEMSHDNADSCTTSGSGTRSVSPSGYPFPDSETKDENSDCEVKKGRFSVNQSWKQVQHSEGTLSSGHLSEESSSSDRLLYRTPSQDNMVDRKSRFEIQHTSHQGSVSSASTSPPLHMIPLSRENSLSSAGTALTREGSSNSKPPKYLIERDREGLREKDVDSQYLSEPRKVGRFELTGGTGDFNSRLTADKGEVPLHPYESPNAALSSVTTSPSSSLSRGQPLKIIQEPATLQTQFEELVRHTEAQQQMLQEMCSSLGFNITVKQRPSLERTSLNIHSAVTPSALSVDAPDASAKAVQTGTVSGELLSTMDYLEHLVQLSLRENASLQRENEALRRELEQLRAGHIGKNGKA